MGSGDLEVPEICTVSVIAFNTDSPSCNLTRASWFIKDYHKLRFTLDIVTYIGPDGYLNVHLNYLEHWWGELMLYSPREMSYTPLSADVSQPELWAVTRNHRARMVDDRGFFSQ